MNNSFYMIIKLNLMMIVLIIIMMECSIYCYLSMDYLIVAILLLSLISMDLHQEYYYCNILMME